MRPFILIPSATTVVALLAGCGGGAKTYEFTRTQACLKEQGQLVRPAPATDFVAANALGGALNVKFPANQVTIAFGLDSAEADRIANAYRRFRGRNIGIEDALSVRGNVVLLWGLTPGNEESAGIDTCLKGP